MLCEQRITAKRDEPTLGVDPLSRRELWRMLAAFRGARKTVVLATSYMDEAARCDRLLLLREGLILADLSPAELLRRTGATDLDEAFLRLVEGGAGA